MLFWFWFGAFEKKVIWNVKYRISFVIFMRMFPACYKESIYYYSCMIFTKSNYQKKKNYLYTNADAKFPPRKLRRTFFLSIKVLRHSRRPNKRIRKSVDASHQIFPLSIHNTIPSVFFFPLFPVRWYFFPRLRSHLKRIQAAESRKVRTGRPKNSNGHIWQGFHRQHRSLNNLTCTGLDLFYIIIIYILYKSGTVLTHQSTRILSKQTNEKSKKKNVSNIYRMLWKFQSVFDAVQIGCINIKFFDCLNWIFFENLLKR